MESNYFTEVKQDQNLTIDYTSLVGSFQHRPTIYLGFGGVGTNAVASCQELFLKTFENATDIPRRRGIPLCYHFLGFDSASSRPERLVENEEWFKLESRGLLEGVFEKMLRAPENRDWLYNGVGAHDFKTGCGGFRNFGRFLFGLNISTFAQAITNASNAAMGHQIAQNNLDPHICLFASLAGGTGAGCVLDAAFYIRRNLPGWKVSAFLALPESIPGNPPMELHLRARTGVYASLREIDHFMSNERRTSWIQKQPNRQADFSFYGGQFSGRYDKPFDSCYIFGPANDRGVHGLKGMDDASNFMARFGFALTSYQVDHLQAGAQRQSFDQNINNVAGGAAVGTNRGSNRCYYVPGLVSFHASVGKALDLATFLCARDLLAAMSKGRDYPKDRRDAEGFLRNRQIMPNTLYNDFRLKLSEAISCPDKATLGRISKTFDDKRLRYKQEGKTIIFGELEKYHKEEGLVEVEKAFFLAEGNGPGAVILTAFKGELLKTAVRLVRDPDYFKVGVEDFFSDLNYLLDEMLVDADSQVANAQAAWMQHLNDYSGQLEKDLVDVTVDSGILDLDFLKIRKTKEHYMNFLPLSHARMLELAAARFVQKTLLGCQGALTEFRKVASDYFNNVEAAQKQILGFITRINQELDVEGRGDGHTLESLCSWNLTDCKWVSAYRKARQLDDAKTILSRICDWNPFAVALGDRKALSQSIAEDICRTLDPLFDGDRATFSQWSQGTGLNEICQFLSSADGQGVSVLAMDAVRKVSAQYATNFMNTTVQTPVNKILMVGGPPQFTKKVVDGSGGASNLSDAGVLVSFETNRLTLYSVSFPISLAGCDRIRGLLKPDHDQHLKNDVGVQRKKWEDFARAFYCFPESWRWQDPTWLQEGSDEVHKCFARAFAVGLLLHEGRPKLPTEINDVLTACFDQLDTLSPNSPREKRLGIFKLGKADFWLTPPFDFTKGKATDIGKEVRPPRNLGKNVIDAYQAYQNDPDLTSMARQWVQWFETKCHTLFVSNDLTAGLQQATKLISQFGKNNKQDSPEAEAWEKILEDVRSWQEDMVPD